MSTTAYNLFKPFYFMICTDRNGHNNALNHSVVRFPPAWRNVSLVMDFESRMVLFKKVKYYTLRNCN